MAAAFNNLLTIRVAMVDPSQEFEDIVGSAKRVKILVNRIDRIMFGRSGSLATSIKEQGRAGAQWDELSPEYEEWKRWAKLNKIRLPEIPPNTVKSEKIWIRTGKFQQFTQKVGNGRFKTIRIYPKALLKGDVFYEVYADDIEYWQFANEQRPIAFFTDDDKKAISVIVEEWMEENVVIYLKAAGLVV